MHFVFLTFCALFPRTLRVSLLHAHGPVYRIVVPQLAQSLTEPHSLLCTYAHLVCTNTGTLACARVQALRGMKGIEFELANRMVENVITTISIPVGVATNVIVDGVERL